MNWPKHFRHYRAGHWLILGLAGVLLVLLSLPVYTVIERGIASILQLTGVGLPSILAALTLSLGTSAVSLGVIVLLGTPLAFVLARSQFRLNSAISLIVELPIVMPPVVAGLALLAAFGRRGLVGAGLNELGILITFSPAAVIIAQIFVAAPFYVRTAQSTFAALPRDLEQSAQIDGANGWQVFWLVMLPISLRAMLTGLMLAWARALGEFGATIIFAGNLAGRTQTMPLLVYSALERDLNATYATALILLVLAAAILALTRLLATHNDGDETHTA